MKIKYVLSCVVLFAVLFMVTVTPAAATSSPTWRPYVGAQTRFLSSSAFEAFFGGAAYPGKTECLLMEALRQIHHPRYNGILFRRTFPQLEGADGLIARSLNWYPAYGGKYNDTKHVWKFPSGARIYFGHLLHEDDIYDYQGWQLAYVAFDELTQFLETQYLYLFSRCRVDPDSGLRSYIRSAGNPGGIGHKWVKKRFVAQGIVNKIDYFTRINDVDTKVDKSHPDARSRVFFPASWRDNPKTNPEYLANLKQLDPVTYAQLAEGDWDAENIGDRVYGNWSSIINVTAEADYKPGISVWWGFDDGYVYGAGPGSASYHPRVILLAQVNNIGGLDIFDEYYSTGEADYNTTIDNVLAKPYPPPDVAYGDSSAAMFKGSLMLRGILAGGATHEVLEGVRNLRRMIRDGNSVVLFRVHPRCQHFIEEMGSYRYEPIAQVKGGDRKPLKIDDHGPDVARYLAWQLRRQ